MGTYTHETVIVGWL